MSESNATAPSRVRSWLFVGVQFICLAVIAITGPLISLNGPLCVLEFFSLTLGIWAIATMRPGNFNVVPDVVPEGRLVIWILLCIDLLLKLRYEEALLVRHYRDYARYQREKKRLVPGVW